MAAALASQTSPRPTIMGISPKLTLIALRGHILDTPFLTMTWPSLKIEGPLHERPISSPVPSLPRHIITLTIVRLPISLA